MISVLYVDTGKDFFPAFKMWHKFCVNGIRCSFHGERLSLRKQMKLAGRQGSTFCLIYGFSEGLVLKDMKTGEQEVVTEGEVFDRFMYGSDEFWEVA